MPAIIPALDPPSPSEAGDEGAMIGWDVEDELDGDDEDDEDNGDGDEGSSTSSIVSFG